MENPETSSAERSGGSLERMVGCEQVRAAILAEPELPGEMPDKMWEEWRTLDKEAAAEFLRATVRATKRGILKRLNLEASNNQAEL